MNLWTCSKRRPRTSLPLCALLLAGGAFADTITPSTETVYLNEGAFQPSLLVAGFTDSNPTQNIADFSATINWGDASGASAASIFETAGQYSVTGSHTYAEAGTYTATTQIHSTQGGSALVGSTMNVLDVPLENPVFDSVPMIEGTAYNGMVATFQDANTQAQPIDYAVTINWGDGSTTADTELVQTGPGLFSIDGAHTYAESGSYAVSISILDIPGGNTLTINGTYNVADAALNGTGSNFTGTANLPGNFTAGSFQDANPNPLITDFSALINWGDGSSPSAADIVQVGSMDLYQVRANHTYLSSGFFTVSTQVNDFGGSSTQFTSTADIVSPAPEPATSMLLAAAVATCVLRRRRSTQS